MVKKTIACFCIVTPSFLPQAMVLMSTIDNGLQENNIKKLLFVVGAAEEHFNLPYPNMEIIGAEHLVDTELLTDLTERYTPAEMCWALKSILAIQLIERFDQLYYFDSDIFIYSDFSLIVNELDNANILLTPHYLDDFPYDGCDPVIPPKKAST